MATELLDVHVQNGRGDATALAFEDQQLTFAELQQVVNRLGNGLTGLGIGPGDRVVLRVPNRPEFVAAWLAIQKIGAVGVATMPMLRAREIAYMVNDSEARMLIVAEDLMAEVETALPQITTNPLLVLAGKNAVLSVVVQDLRSVAQDPSPERQGFVAQDFSPAKAGAARDLRSVAQDFSPASAGAVAPSRHSLADLMAAGSPELHAFPSRRDDLALIAYTSGSTGAPKGACHTPADILASTDTFARYILQPTPFDVFGGHPTLAFTFGLGMLVFPLRFGARCVLLDGFTPERLLATVQRERMTVLFCGATTYRLLLQIPDLERRFDLSSLRVCVSAGEPLPRPVYDEWIARTGIELLDCLGSTEMFQVFLCQRQGAVNPGATGLAVPGYEVRIVDEQLAEVPRGTPGLLAVRGPTGCKYWRKPDRQADYVRGGWNIPNDVVMQDESGYFWYQCRNDDLIICAGNNVSPPDVEAGTPRASGGARSGGGRIAGRPERVRALRVCGVEAGRLAERRSRRGPAGARETRARPIQVPAEDPLCRCAAEDGNRKDSPRRAAPAGSCPLSNSLNRPAHVAQPFRAATVHATWGMGTPKGVRYACDPVST